MVSIKDRVSKAAIFARVSTAAQDKGKPSVDVQLERTRAWAEQRGWTVTQEYVERAVSGALRLEARPEIGRLVLDAALAKEFHVVVFLEPTRMGRDPAEFHVLARDLRERGVLVAFVDNAQVLDYRKDALLLGLFAGIGGDEAQRIKARMTMGRIEAARKGGHMARPPRGYRNVKGADKMSRLTIVEDEAEMIRFAFESVVAGVGTAEVAQRVNERFNPKDRWTHHSIGRLMTRDFYAGEPKPFQFVIDPDTDPPTTETIMIPCPAIVDRDTFDRAAANFLARQTAIKSEKGDGPLRWHAYGLRSILHRHANELVKMGSVPRIKGDTVIRYYRCNARGKCPSVGIGRNGQRRTAIQSARIEARVILWALDLLADPDRIAAWQEEADREVLAVERTDLGLAENEDILKATGAAMEKLGERYDWGHIDKEAYLAKMADLKGRQEEIKAVIARIHEVHDRSEGLRTTIADLMEGRVPLPSPGELEPVGPDAHEQVRWEWETQRRAIRKAAQRHLDGRSRDWADEDRDAMVTICAFLAGRFDVEVIIEDYGEPTGATAFATWNPDPRATVRGDALNGTRGKADDVSRGCTASHATRSAPCGVPVEG